MNLLGAIPWWARIAGYAVLFLGGLVTGIYETRKIDESRYEKLESEYQHFRDTVAVKGAEQEKKTAEAIAKQTEINRQAGDDYETKLAAIRAYYARRLRDAHAAGASGGQVSALPEPAAIAHESPAYLELASACAETTQQLVSLQEWIRSEANATHP